LLFSVVNSVTEVLLNH